MAYQGPQFQGPPSPSPQPFQAQVQPPLPPAGSAVPVCSNGHPVPSGAQFCPVCSLPVGTLVCNNGHVVGPGHRFCPQCGAPAGPWRTNVAGPGYVRPYGDQFSDWWAASGAGANRRLSGPGPAILLAWSRHGLWRRVGAALIDYVAVGVLLAIPAFGIIIYLAAYFANAYLEGTTGQTLGKKAVGIYTVRKDTGEFIGGAVGIGRKLLHILDTLALFTGWIVGLITNRTYADMIIGTVVVRRPSRQQAATLPYGTYPPQL
jgi:hypothetical protein